MPDLSYLTRLNSDRFEPGHGLLVQPTTAQHLDLGIEFLETALKMVGAISRVAPKGDKALWHESPSFPDQYPVALAVGPDIDYVKVRDHEDGARYIMAEARIKTYFPL